MKYNNTFIIASRAYFQHSLVFYSCIKHLRINLARMPLLGNAVISKKILRTCKIMVIHSNERRECVYVPS